MAITMRPRQDPITYFQEAGFLRDEEYMYYDVPRRYVRPGADRENDAQFIPRHTVAPEGDRQ